MNRKHIIEHFRELAEMAGKPLTVEYKGRNGLRLIYAGRRACLPNRERKIRHISAFERKLGLRPSLLLHALER